MKNRLVVLILLLFTATVCLSQQPLSSQEPALQDFAIKRQIVSDSLEHQIKDIPYAAVRAHIRYKLASWLWNGGNANSGAEEIAVRAIDDLYENKSEIPEVYFNALSPELFALLDSHSRDVANKLREKHKVTTEAGLFDALLSQNGGDRLATDAAIKALANHSRTNMELVFLLERLRERRSPQLFTLLRAIIDAEETGNTKSTASNLFLMTGYFVAEGVSEEIQKRYLRLVINRSRSAAQVPDGDAEGFLHLLSGLIPKITTIFPEIISEVNVVQTVLKTRASEESKEDQERNERLRNSPDKLAALVEEAEKTNNAGSRNDLYVRAAQLALQQKKFTYAVDLVEKTLALDKSVPFSEISRTRWRDQFYGDVATSAVQSNDPDAASYANKRVTDTLAKAEILRKLALYYIGRNNSDSARSALNEAITRVSKVDPTPQSISSLTALIPVAQSVDPSSVSDINKVIAGDINGIKSLDSAESRETEKYKNYVASIMHINWNLLPALTRLVKTNRYAVTDMEGGINKKEIRIIATFVLMTDLVSQEKVRN